MAPPKQTPRANAQQRVLRAALGATPNLTLLGLGSATAGGLALAMGPVAGALTLALSAVSYGALVAMDIFSPRFVERVLSPPAPAQPTSTDAGEIVSAEVRAELVAVKAAHARVVTELRESGGVFGADLVEIATRADGLVEQAGQLALRSNLLFVFLSEKDESKLTAEAEGLERRADSTRDAEAAAGFRQAAASRRGALQTRVEIAALVDRIQAQLTLISSALEEMRGRLVKMRAQDAGDMGRIGASMVDRLTSLRDEVGVLEHSIADISQSVKGALG